MGSKPMPSKGNSDGGDVILYAGDASGAGSDGGVSVPLIILEKLNYKECMRLATGKSHKPRRFRSGGKTYINPAAQSKKSKQKKPKLEILSVEDFKKDTEAFKELRCNTQSEPVDEIVNWNRPFNYRTAANVEKKLIEEEDEINWFDDKKNENTLHSKLFDRKIIFNPYVIFAYLAVLYSIILAIYFLY